jgi:UDP-2,3-diacylglucosamine pyrophosphatase LpxH
MKSLFHDAKVGGIRQQALFTVTIGLTWYSRPANTPNGALHVHTQRMRNNAMKRPIDILVLSDLHLGTYGCRAKELTAYLRTVKPRMVVLNGDIIDIWQFKKSYFPKSHMQVLKRLLKMAGKIPVYYITGNHDEALRRYSPASLGQLQLLDRLSLSIGGERYWFFHGDIFDASMKHAKWLAKLGGFGYDLLIRINTVVNHVLSALGKPRMSFSKRVKNSVKRAVAYIGDFEETAASIAVHEGFQHVVCGHIHQPQIRRITTAKGSVNYMNSGDWIEHMSALEYVDGQWSLYFHEPSRAAVAKPTVSSVAKELEYA